jgi:hypothetical protein
MLKKRVGVAQTYLVSTVAQEKAHLKNLMHEFVKDARVDILKKIMVINVNNALPLHVLRVVKGSLFAMQTQVRIVTNVRRTSYLIVLDIPRL